MLRYIKLHLIIIVVLSLTVASLSAQNKAPLTPVPLWPRSVPGEPNNALVERDNTKPTDNMVAGKPVIRLTDVSIPTITVYPPKGRNTGAAMIVCPGGGYSILAIDLEGTEICDWLNSLGMTAVLLKYRVPARQGLPRYQAPAQDAQRALGLVRYNARKWNIDPQKIGIMGFSAGAHLSATVSTNYKERMYERVDEADAVSCRPDFVMLVYPAYLTVKEQGDRIAPELHVDSTTAPTLLVQTEDDPVRVESSLYYYLALKKEKVPAEMHLYAKGGHGYGLRSKGTGINSWPAAAQGWLQTIGMLEAIPK